MRVGWLVRGCDRPSAPGSQASNLNSERRTGAAQGPLQSSSMSHPTWLQEYRTGPIPRAAARQLVDTPFELAVEKLTLTNSGDATAVGGAATSITHSSALVSYASSWQLMSGGSSVGYWSRRFRTPPTRDRGSMICCPT